MELKAAMAEPGNSYGSDHNAVWVGGLDLDTVAVDGDVALEAGARYARARLLVWGAGRVRGFVEVPVSAGKIAVSALRAALKELPSRPPERRAEQPAISVVVCTRDRPDELEICLEALLALDYPTYEVIVVDSVSKTTATREVAAAHAADGVRYVRVELPGLSRARNAGVEAATYEYVAYTDDDVVVDVRWLAGISRGFAAVPDVGCVTGLVASGQLETAAQRYFDSRVTWARNTTRTVFSLANPPDGYPLFPFQFGAYGTGANFAATKSLLYSLGGFDEALGPGSPTGGADDIDWFSRVVLSGRALVFEPDAVVWHKHRLGEEDLAAQLEDYGSGLAALLTKLLGNREARRAIAPLMFRGAVHGWRMLRADEDVRADYRRSYARREVRGMFRGPIALLRSRPEHSPRPLKAR